MTRVLLRFYLSPDRPLGPGKIKILESIRDGGSISEAARGMRMSYRSAWLLVDSMNSQFKQPVVSDHRRPRRRIGHADAVRRECDSAGPRHGAPARRAVAKDLAALERDLPSRPPQRRKAPSK